MEFKKLIEPVNLQDFMHKFNNAETFVIKGSKNKFLDLISLEEIENVVNNGCNFSTPLEIIQDGGRRFYVEKNIPWTQFASNKTIIKKFLEKNHSFLMRNQSQINPKVAALITSIENTFDFAADLHLYVSPVTSGSGYDAHRDRPQHKIYLQVIGRTNWTIFSYKKDLPENVGAIKSVDEKKYLNELMTIELNPGDLLYMPPDTFHKVRNHNEPRISFSIPFNKVEEKFKKMDRTHIPFKQIFESNL